MRRARLVLVVSVIGALGCGEDPAPAGGDETQTPESAPQPAEIPPATPAQELMHGHYRRASEARDALIRADMDTASDHMAWLATHEEGSALPDSLQPMLNAMQTEAARFAEASTLTEAGLALSRTLVRCGACHQASDGGFAVALPPVPEGDSSAAHMRRHQWAADRMWEGLVTADVEQFEAGAGALHEVPLHDEELPAAEDHPAEQLEAITNLVHELGSEAADATTPDERASIYGRYLATCATCHRLLGRGPIAPPEPTLEK